MTIRYCDKQSSADATKPCPHVALVGTRQCLEHREPGALVPIPAPIPLTRRDWLLGEQPDRATRRLPPVPTLPPPSPWTETERMLDRLGQILDHVDFAEAHGDIRPELAAALTAAAEEHLTGIVTTTVPARAEPVTLDDIVEMMNRLTPGAHPMPEVIKLTREQIDTVLRSTPLREPWAPGTTIWGVPVEIVDTVEESTPYEWRHAVPSPLVFDSVLSEEDLAEIRRRWEREAATALYRDVVIAEAAMEPVKPRTQVVPFGPPFTGLGLIPELRRSIVGRIWQKLRWWAR